MLTKQQAKDPDMQVDLTFNVWRAPTKSRSFDRNFAQSVPPMFPKLIWSSAWVNVDPILDVSPPVLKKFEFDGSRRTIELCPWGINPMQTPNISTLMISKMLHANVPIAFVASSRTPWNMGLRLHHFEAFQQTFNLVGHNFLVALVLLVTCRAISHQHLESSSNPQGFGAALQTAWWHIVMVCLHEPPSQKFAKARIQDQPQTSRANQHS